MFRSVQLVVVLVALLVGSSGCATHALWTEVDLDTWNEPAQNPNLRLFRNETKKDFLVVYEENRERDDIVRTKAYLLDANRERIKKQQRPQFVSAGSRKNLPAV